MAYESDLTAFQADVLEQKNACTPVRYLETRAEIVDYYQQEYGTDWTNHIIDDLMKQTGKNRNTVSREFQYDKRIGQERYKGTKVTKATAQKYIELGKKLPGIYTAPKGGYQVTFIGEILISDSCWPRSFTVKIPFPDAQEFAETADVDIIWKWYWKGGPFPAEGVCGEPDVIITCLDEEEREEQEGKGEKKQKPERKKPEPKTFGQNELPF